MLQQVKDSNHPWRRSVAETRSRGNRPKEIGGARGYHAAMALFGRESARDQQKVEAWRRWILRQHPLALTAAVLSIFSLTHFGTLFVDELAGIILGVIAIRRAARAPELSVRLAYVGVIVGTLSLICAIVLYAQRPGS